MLETRVMLLKLSVVASSCRPHGIMTSLVSGEARIGGRVLGLAITAGIDRQDRIS